MNGIQGIGSYAVERPQAAQAKTKPAVSQPETDVYSARKQPTAEAEKTRPFTKEAAGSLAEKYNVRSMSRNSYSRLLQELRDSGMISSKEFSEGYSGSGLPEEIAEALPFGEDEADFLRLLQKGAALCSEAPETGKPDGICARFYQIFQQIDAAGNGAEAETALPPQSSDPPPTTEAGRLLQLLRQDESFSKAVFGFSSHPLGRYTVKTMILESKELQDQVAQRMWYSAAQCNARYLNNPRGGAPVYLPKTPQGYDIKGMLLSGNAQTVGEVLFAYHDLLITKARTCGLTETERFLQPDAKALELRERGTFQERMQPVLDEIEQGFQEAGMTFDREKSYSFHLDTSTFTLSVSGGTEDENSLINQIVNTWSYSNLGKQTFHTIMDAFYSHRPDNMQYNPWMTDNLIFGDELLPKYGIANVPRAYTDKMRAFLPAYQLSRMDKRLKYQYGFGVNDLRYSKGKLAGSTDEITRFIEDPKNDFMKKAGYLYLELRKEYTVTPNFTEDIFVFENGKFSTKY